MSLFEQSTDCVCVAVMCGLKGCDVMTSPGEETIAHMLTHGRKEFYCLWPGCDVSSDSSESIGGHSHNHFILKNGVKQTGTWRCTKPNTDKRSKRKFCGIVKDGHHALHKHIQASHWLYKCGRAKCTFGPRIRSTVYSHLSIGKNCPVISKRSKVLNSACKQSRDAPNKEEKSKVQIKSPEVERMKSEVNFVYDSSDWADRVKWANWVDSLGSRWASKVPPQISHQDQCSESINPPNKKKDFKDYCGVCLEEFENLDDVKSSSKHTDHEKLQLKKVTFPCEDTHTFHHKCVLKFSAIRKSCWNCSAPIPPPYSNDSESFPAKENAYK